MVAASAEITENILPLSVVISANNTIRCFGDRSATVQAAISGGKLPYAYTWSDANIGQGESLKALGAGNYTLTVTDAEGKTAAASVVVKQPDLLELRVAVKSAAATNQANGQAVGTVKGGVPPYTFAWDNKENTETALHLPAGSHTLAVTDANGCTATGSVEITENILPLVMNLSQKNAIRCQGKKEAALSLTIEGGKPPFKILWSDAALQGEQVANLGPGTYAVTVTDAAGKELSKSITVSEPPLLSAAAELVAAASVNQSDSAAQLKVSGGATPYQYAWDNGETSTKAVKLPPGANAATVTDANGCTAIASIGVPENILPLLASIEGQSGIRCAGAKEGSLSVKVSGGKPPYIFLWSNPAFKGEALKGLGAGEYAVTVSDAKGTTATAAYMVTAPDSLKAELIRKVGATTDRTRDGKAMLSVSGGKPEYSIVWDNEEKGTNARQLIQGPHSVTVTDANGCNAKLSFETGKRILPALTEGMLSNGQTIRMERLQFEADSSRLTPDCLPVLDEVYDFLAENGKIVIEIGGHTNSTPPDEFCDRLSSARAKSVADYLITKGIDPKRVVSKGYGKRKPIVSNATPEGRRQNQRVEIKILEIN
ncbi:MAG: OmpA family protein [Lewinellaceae bacterium]|nr:OmpA family protein [Lewinellaceae bacterium]